MGEEAYRTAQRLGDRSLLLFSGWPDGFCIRRYRGVREGGGSPRQSAHEGPTPGGSGLHRKRRDGDGGLARRPGRGRSARGGGRRADRPGRRSTAENQSSRPSAWRQPSPEGDWTRRSLSPARSSRSRPGPKQPTHRRLLVHCSTTWRCLTIRQSLIPSYQRFLPRFRDHFTTCQVLAPAVDGPVDTREIDAVIARRAGMGIGRRRGQVLGDRGAVHDAGQASGVSVDRSVDRHRAGLARDPQTDRFTSELNRSRIQSTRRSPSVVPSSEAKPSSTVVSGIRVPRRDSISASE